MKLTLACRVSQTMATAWSYSGSLNSLDRGAVALLALLGARLQDVHVVDRLGLGLQEVDHPMDLVVRQEGAVDAAELGPAVA